MRKRMPKDLKNLIDLYHERNEALDRVVSMRSDGDPDELEEALNELAAAHQEFTDTAW